MQASENTQRTDLMSFDDSPLKEENLMIFDDEVKPNSEVFPSKVEYHLLELDDAQPLKEQRSLNAVENNAITKKKEAEIIQVALVSILIFASLQKIISKNQMLH